MNVGDIRTADEKSCGYAEQRERRRRCSTRKEGRVRNAANSTTVWRTRGKTKSKITTARNTRATGGLANEIKSCGTERRIMKIQKKLKHNTPD